MAELGPGPHRCGDIAEQLKRVVCNVEFGGYGACPKILESTRALGCASPPSNPLFDTGGERDGPGERTAMNGALGVFNGFRLVFVHSG